MPLSLAQLYGEAIAAQRNLNDEIRCPCMEQVGTQDARNYFECKESADSAETVRQLWTQCWKLKQAQEQEPDKAQETGPELTPLLGEAGASALQLRLEERSKPHNDGSLSWHTKEQHQGSISTTGSASAGFAAGALLALVLLAYSRRSRRTPEALELEGRSSALG